MITLKIFAYIFFAYGLTNIVVFGRGPFGMCEFIRNLADRISNGLGKLFHCPMCFSTWVGAGISLIDILFLKDFVFTPFNLIFSCMGGFWIGLLTVAMDAFLTSGIVWILHQFEEALERHGYTAEVEEVSDDGQ